jgi:hypothetical protein
MQTIITLEGIEQTSESGWSTPGLSVHPGDNPIDGTTMGRRGRIKQVQCGIYGCVSKLPARRSAYVQDARKSHLSYAFQARYGAFSYLIVRPPVR